MDYREIQTRGGDLVVEGLRHFCLDDMLCCGQCFRWQPLAPGQWQGIVAGRLQSLTQQGDRLILHDTPLEAWDAFWRDYLDLARDYGEVKEILSQDEIMRRAIRFTPGMRVLRQPIWETLCSFIISANNNIPRIRGIVERLCELLGEPTAGGFSFPEPAKLAACSEEDLAPLRCGYRAAYLIDAARKVQSGALDLAALHTLPLDEARKALCTVKGVGPKVAECVLLYGAARAECVPVDVWILRALAAHYPDGMPGEIAPVAGLGQQYLFHWIRSDPKALEADDASTREEVFT